MPHLVEMHKKYSGAGLIVITVNTDDAADKEARDGIRKFLADKQVDVINLLLDEPMEFMQEKLRFSFLPCYYVFNRQGKWTQFQGDDLDYQAMDKLVLESLKEK